MVDTKTGAKGRRRARLTKAFVKSAPAGRFTDGLGGHGLMLIVKPSGARNWIQRITINGKRHDLGLGAYPYVTLDEAREMAFDNKRNVRRGVDILAKRRTAPTFAEALESVLTLNAPAWRGGEKTVRHWRNTLAANVLPRLGSVQVDAIQSRDVAAVLEPLASKPETARKIRQRVSRVMDWAIAQGYRSDNPVKVAAAALPKCGPAKTEHMRAVPWQRIAATMAAVVGAPAYVSTTLALRFLALTVTRSGEVRGARWGEIDRAGAVWTIPGERTKTGRPFRVALSTHALAVLDEAEALRDGTDLIFPSLRGKVISDNTLSKLFRENKIPAVPHGFRSTFRDWCSEAAGVPSDVAEAALAHVNGDKTIKAYARSDLLERRRPVMEQWGELVTAPATKGESE